jgi:dTDP-4-amino-4,6-dideoxygalactose transaminase
VHLYGHPANMTALRAIADKHGIAIYEDAAQAHGAEWNGQRVGTFGDFAMFSLYPTKNMTSGEGGMVSCKDEHIARNVKLYRNQGMEKRYENEVIGFNARMTDVHAAIGRAQLAKLPGWTKQRQDNAAFLNANLRGVVVPAVAPEATHVWHQYTIRVVDQDRDAFAAELGNRGVGSGVYYPIPNHRLPSLTHFAPDLHLEQTEIAAQQALSLPVHPALSQADLETIVETVNAVAAAGA